MASKSQNWHVTSTLSSQSSNIQYEPKDKFISQHQ